MTFSSPWRVKVRYSAAGKNTHRTHPPASERGGPPFGAGSETESDHRSFRSPPLFSRQLSWVLRTLSFRPLSPDDVFFLLRPKTNEGSPEENRIGRRGRPPFSASFRGDRSPLLSLRRQIHFEKVEEEEKRRGKSGRDSTTYV